MDVLQEGGAGQFRDPLAVELMPEATRSRRRKIRSELTHLAMFFLHFPKRPHTDATLFPCWALQRQNLTEPPNNCVPQ